MTRNPTGNLSTIHDFQPLTPTRLFDTRLGQSPEAVIKVAKSKVTPTAALVVKVAGVASVPASGVGAVSLNVAVTNPDAAGWVKVFGCGTPPSTANVNFNQGQTVSNAVLTPVGSDGTICFASYVPTDLVVDINGRFFDGSGLRSIAPTRLLDTRPANSPDAVIQVDKVSTDTGRSASCPSRRQRARPATGVSGASLNVAVTNASAAGWVKVYGCGDAPSTANVNFTQGQTVSNTVLTPVSATGDICLPISSSRQTSSWTSTRSSSRVPASTR